MAATSTGWLLNSFRSTYRHVTGCNVYPGIFVQTRDYAARKGTREKARKKKVKVVIEKVGFIPHNQRKSKSEAKKKVVLIKPTIDDSWKSMPETDVYKLDLYRQKIYSFEEALQCHREMHHPTVYNLPNSYIQAMIELDMQGEKKTKFVNTFTRVVDVPHRFDLGIERKVLAFCKALELQRIARDAGGTFVGGRELVKQIQAGEFPVKEYNYCVAHQDILPDLLLIRGLLKKKYPSSKLGTVTNDIGTTVSKFLYGVEYTAFPSAIEKDYGTIEVAFGKLDMDAKKLEENLSAIINDIESVKPTREGPFILRVQLMSRPLTQKLKIDFQQYLPVVDTEVEEGDVEDAVIATN